jgi:hypothetical protein
MNLRPTKFTRLYESPAASLGCMSSLLSTLAGNWKPRIQAPHQLDRIINRIPKRVFLVRATAGTPEQEVSFGVTAKDIAELS